MILEANFTEQSSEFDADFGVVKVVRKVEPGNYVKTVNGKAPDENGNVEVKRYWEPVFEPDENTGLDELVDKIDDAMQNSIKMHKISDVEVGSFLSSLLSLCPFNPTFYNNCREIIISLQLQ